MPSKHATNFEIRYSNSYTLPIRVEGFEQSFFKQLAGGEVNIAVRLRHHVPSKLKGNVHGQTLTCRSLKRKC